MLFDQFLCILEIRKFMWGLFFSNDAVKPYILHDAWNRLVKSDLCIVSISYLGNSQLLEYSVLFHTHTFPSLFRCTLFTQTFYTSINFRAVWTKPFCIILLLKCLGCCLFVNVLLVENVLLFQKMLVLFSITWKVAGVPRCHQRFSKTYWQSCLLKYQNFYSKNLKI